MILEMAGSKFVRAILNISASHVLPGSYDNKRAFSEQLSVSARRSSSAIFGYHADTRPLCPPDALHECALKDGAVISQL